MATANPVEPINHNDPNLEPQGEETVKPLPEAVQRAFPCAHDRLPERPWWRLDAIEDGVSACRRADGKMNLKPLAGVDAAHPLPHPGYRAGQVWADEDGRSVVCANERGSFLSGVVAGPLSLYDAGYRYLMADPACPHLAPWSPVGDLP
jgi:hypothetical protein